MKQLVSKQGIHVLLTSPKGGLHSLHTELSRLQMVQLGTVHG